MGQQQLSILAYQNQHNHVLSKYKTPCKMHLLPTIDAPKAKKRTSANFFIEPKPHQKKPKLRANRHQGKLKIVVKIAMPFTKDAFGKPRNSDWSDMAGGLFQAKLNFDDTNGTIDITKRGFTDHEHLDEMQLIHMNGRMYDYNNGRFLSVDPFIQNPTNTQSMNPYTYIFNNPLSGVDPTGYISLGLGGMLGGNRPCGILEANCNPNVGKEFNAGTDGDGKKEQKGGVAETNKQTGVTKNGVCCDFGVIAKSQRENAKNMGVGEFLSKGFGEIANNPEYIDGTVSVAGQQITDATGGLINGEAVINVTGAGDIVKGVITGGNQAAEGNLKGAGTTIIVAAVQSKVKLPNVKVGGGATLEKLSSGEIKRIQNAANKSGKDIAIVGSRVNPNKALHKNSDFDFVIDANSKTRNNLSKSLPGSKSIKDGTHLNQDIFKGKINKDLPHVIFKPETKL